MKNDKKIIMLCQYFYPEYISSAVLPFQTAIDLSKHNVDVNVICGFPYEYSLDKYIEPSEKINSKFKIKRIKYSKFKKTSYIGRLLNYFSFTFFTMLSIKEFKNKDICIVYSNPPIIPIVPYIAKRIYGLKIIFVSYDVYPEIAVATKAINKNSILVKIMNTANKIVFPSFDKIIVLSSEMKRYLLNSRKIAEGKIEIVPNWYDNSDINPTHVTSKSKLNKTFVISYFGNMGTAQDMDTIKKTIKIFFNDKKYLFLLVGHGNKKEELKAYFKREGIKNVEIHDFLQGAELNQKLNDSDVFLVSLEKNLAGLAVPSKTYTYLSMGKPVIAIMDSDTDVAKELTEFRAGFSIENSNCQQLKNYIHLLCEDEKLYNQMSNNALELYNLKYTRKLGTKKYKEIIEKM